MTHDTFSNKTGYILHLIHCLRTHVIYFIYVGEHYTNQISSSIVPAAVVVIIEFFPSLSTLYIINTVDNSVVGYLYDVIIRNNLQMRYLQSNRSCIVIIINDIGLS